ncbi:MAG: type II toxin-antitoxin system PemK/MazF family toxin [Pseudonocardiaceae bacterium]
MIRPIHTAHLDKVQPVLILTRELVRPHLSRVTVAPITSTILGLSTEVPVGSANGLDDDSVVSCDSIVTVPTSALGRQIGYLLPAQEAQLATAIRAAFDLD